MCVSLANTSLVRNDASRDYSALRLFFEGYRYGGDYTGVIQGASELKLGGMTGVHNWHKIVMGELGFRITSKASPLGLPSATVGVGIPTRAVGNYRRRGGIRLGRVRRGQRGRANCSPSAATPAASHSVPQVGHIRLVNFDMTGA